MVDDMVMARVVQSDKYSGIINKLSINSRGPFRVIEDHNNGLYYVQLFGKPEGAVTKFLAHFFYTLPPHDHVM